MNIRDNYRSAINTYSDGAIDEEKAMRSFQSKGSRQKKANGVRRRIITVSIAIMVFSSVIVTGAVTNWRFFSELFEKVFDDPISAEITQAGILQKINITHENDDFTLKLLGFTGTSETHIALFELTTKQKIENIDKITLLGRTFSPRVLEANKKESYGINEFDGRELNFNAKSNTYYFSCQLPPFWVRDNNEDVVLYISGIEFYSDTGLVKSIACDMIFQFTPDRGMLKAPLVLDVNQALTKDVFEDCNFFLDSSIYSEYMMDIDEIIAPREEATVRVNTVIVSKYSTEIQCTIMGENLTELEGRIIWDQFTEPIHTTRHFYDGMEFEDHYYAVAIDNKERIRLFVDGVEVPVDKETLRWNPGRGHDENGKKITKGDMNCEFMLEGFDYEAAQTVELRFGDIVIPLKESQ